MNSHLFELTCSAKSQTKEAFPAWFASLDTTDRESLTTWASENATGDPYHVIDWMAEYISWEKSYQVYRRAADVLNRLKTANQARQRTTGQSL